MSIFVLWIDREKAKILQFTADKMERKDLQSTHTDHHTHAFDELDYQRQEKAFFAKIGKTMKLATKVFILGPGIAKHHFYNYLMEHLPAIAKNVAACETVDHPTDEQLAAYATQLVRNVSAK